MYIRLTHFFLRKCVRRRSHCEHPHNKSHGNAEKMGPPRNSARRQPVNQTCKYASRRSAREKRNDDRNVILHHCPASVEAFVERRKN